MQVRCRAIWILRKQQCVLTSIHVRDIDTAIRADESMARLGDQHAIFPANDLLALLQGKFGDARVELVATRPGTRARGRFDRVQQDQLPLCLRHNLVFDDQNVALRQRNPPAFQCV